MTLPLNIPAIIALADRMETNLPAEVTAVNGQITAHPSWPQYPIEVPVVHNHMPSIAELTQFPAVGIGEGNVDFNDDVGWSATGRFDLACVIYIRSMNGREELVWRMRYTMMAVASVVLDQRNLDGVGWGMVLQRIEPGPILRERDNVTEQQQQARSNTVLGLRTLLFNYRDEQDDM